MPSNHSPIPVTLLTGFLGAGKTTLLNRILRDAGGPRIAVMVNDFGTVNVDAELVVGVEGQTISLANGCVCCSIQGELAEAVRGVLARPERPEHILLETSGVSDPAAIAASFAMGGLAAQTRIDAILCVVDATELFNVPEQMALKTSQLAMSDLILLNKTDLAAQDEIDRVRTWIRRYAERPRILETVRCELPLELLFDRMRPELPQFPVRIGTSSNRSAHSAVEQSHAQEFVTWCFESDRPFVLEQIRVVIRSLPETVYRAKGLCSVTEEPERRALIQVVGGRGELTFEGAWGEERPRTRIVVIGGPNFDSDELQQRFEGCLADQAP